VAAKHLSIRCRVGRLPVVAGLRDVDGAEAFVDRGFVYGERVAAANGGLIANGRDASTRSGFLGMRVRDTMASTEHRENGVFVSDKSCSAERASCEILRGVVRQYEQGNRLVIFPEQVHEHTPRLRPRDPLYIDLQ